jgi:cellulose synthase/poly-beta-1,6-N-acetylglucosamine synthase-like glycosyltransferase
MTGALFYLAFATLLFFAALAAQLVLGRRHRRSLREIPPPSDFPLVSIIIPARNEERNLHEALQSVLAQDYPNREIIVVDDRSTDGTGSILEAMAAEHPDLKWIRVTQLPQGWLGKNHALHLGVAQARGEYLLFTDADVVMAPSALARAVGYMQRENIDHLAVGPVVTMRGLVLNCFAGAFMIFFTLYARPWKIRDPKSPSHIGIGAFNLVRSHAYRAAGGHKAIAMRPDDDMKLGKLIKKRGFRQDLLGGKGMLRVEWYASVKELIGGLEKNTFAGLDYRLSLLIGGTVFCLLAFVWPFAGLFLTTGATRILNAAAVGLLFLVYLDCALAYGVKARYGFGLAPATLLFIYILWRAALMIFLHGGIDWRGTHYPLAELKRNKV